MLIQSSSVSAAVVLMSQMSYVVVDEELGLVVFKHTRSGTLEGAGLPVFEGSVVGRSVQGIAKLEDVLRMWRRFRLY